MKIHILGICGTFMGSVALLAREQGFSVSGSDANVYPPMSNLLSEQGVDVSEGYLPEHIPEDVDYVVVGNVMRRGLPVVEFVLDKGLPYISGPQWLYENILADRWVLAVAGTHGKTTTASMLAWILEYAGLNPGFLIGGVPENFDISSRLGDGPFFVVEADEYDTAFFDKRSKFVHYHPRTVILNNLEYDHADIFPDLNAIQTQFHHLVRMVPGQGRLIVNAQETALKETLDRGCWTPIETFAGDDWSAGCQQADGRVFDVCFRGEVLGQVQWTSLGQHNVNNALAAIAAARHVGVPVAVAIEALGQFKGVKRRMQLRGEVRRIAVYDDFAHHPTAIKTTLQGLRANVGDGRILALLELRSNTMRMGVHQEQLADALSEADVVWFYQPPELNIDLATVAEQLNNGRLVSSIERLLDYVQAEAQPGEHILVMSNGSFGGIHERLLATLATG